MGLLKPASNMTAYLKLGLQGFEGSGKTFLACQFAMGITKLVKGSKIAFFDTEKGSDFWKAKIEAAGFELFQARSRAFIDLLQVIDEAEKGGYSFLIIDSITHVWRDLAESYQKKRGKQRLTMQDWMVLKTEWGQFTRKYVNSPIHIAMCGRAGYEYDFDEDEDGKKEIVKTGTKMKAEGETGFEPDLLIETLKIPKSETLTDKKAKKNAKGYINRCVVLKDRSDTINGKMIDFPKFSDFKSVIDCLNLGGEHAQVSTTDSQALFSEGSDRSWAERKLQVDITLEEISATLTKTGLDGTSAETKKKRIATMEKIFGSSSKTAIENMKLEDLRDGLSRLKIELGLAPGGNGTAPAQEVAPDAVPF